MTTFKKGDRVALNNHVMNNGSATLASLAANGLVVDRTFVIQHGGHYMVRLEGVAGSWSNDRFDLVKTPVAETHNYKVGDRVKAIKPDNVTLKYTKVGDLGTVSRLLSVHAQVQSAVYVTWDSYRVREKITALSEIELVPAQAKLPEAPKVVRLKRGDKVTFRNEPANRMCGYNDVFTFGKVYEVVEGGYGAGLIYVKNDLGKTSLIYGSRFDVVSPTPVAETPSFKVGDRVRFTKDSSCGGAEFGKKGDEVVITNLGTSPTKGEYFEFRSPKYGFAVVGNFCDIELVKAPSFKVGEWVRLNPAHPFNKAGSSHLIAGQRYQVRKVSPSGKTIHLEGRAGGRASARFMRAWVGLQPLAYSDGAIDARIEARATVAPKKTPVSIVVPTSAVYAAVQKYVQDEYGIDAVVAGIAPAATGYSIVLK